MSGGERKLVIRASDMSDDMQQDAVDCALQVSPYMRFVCSKGVLVGRSLITHEDLRTLAGFG